MEKQFELLLPSAHKHKQRLMIGAGVGMLYLLSFSLLAASLKRHYPLGIGIGAFLLGLLIAVALCLPWLVRKMTYAPHLVTITSESISLLNRKTATERQILFADIATYRILPSRNGVAIYFRFSDGSRQTIGSNDFSLLEMTPALKLAINSYNRRHNFPTSERAYTFFGNPAATSFLAFYAAVIVSMAWAIGIPNPNEAGFFMYFVFGGGFILYLIAWYEGREERRNY